MLGGAYKLREDIEILNPNMIRLGEYGFFSKIENPGNHNEGVFINLSDDKYIIVANRKRDYNRNEFRLKYENIFPKIYDAFVKDDVVYTLWHKYKGDISLLLFFDIPKYRYIGENANKLELFHKLLKIKKKTFNDQILKEIEEEFSGNGKYKDITVENYKIFLNQFIEDIIACIPYIAKQIIKLKIQATLRGFSFDKLKDFHYRMKYDDYKIEEHNKTMKIDLDMKNEIVFL